MFYFVFGHTNYRGYDTCSIIVLTLSLSSFSFGISNKNVEKWGIFEFHATGPSEKSSDLNPFIDVVFGAFFQPESSSRTSSKIQINGFYDGDGTYRVRFMPNIVGKWSFVTYSNQESLRGLAGEFNVVPPSTGNRGQAKSFGSHSFRYENGEPYFSVGTTAYTWIHQEKWVENTLQTLTDVSSTFNKIRYTVFPKFYIYTHVEPPFYPYEGTPPNTWQFDRFHPPFWQNFEKRILQIQDLGYVSDLILFHHNDEGHWGFDNMGAKYDQLYLRYVIARFGAFRSIWWSMANEWDSVNKTLDQWADLFRILESEDPYQHERSIHNCVKFYNHNISAITHISLQLGNPDPVSQVNDLNTVKNTYIHKPWVVDECRYEGDIDKVWGNLTPQEMTHLFWLFTTNLAQTGHSETYYKKIDDEEVLFWSKGNVLRGQSAPRLKFYRDYFSTVPISWEEMESHDLGRERYSLTNVGSKKSYFLFFWSGKDSSHHNFELSDEFDEYDLTYIDYYGMKKTLVQTVQSGAATFKPPSVPYILDVRGKEKIT